MIIKTEHGWRPLDDRDCFHEQCWWWLATRPGETRPVPIVAGTNGESANPNKRYV
jgi:hypothetical protein